MGERAEGEKAVAGFSAGRAGISCLAPFLTVAVPVADMVDVVVVVVGLVHH